MARPSLPRKCKMQGSSAPAPGGIRKGPAKPKALPKRKAPAKAKPKAKGKQPEAAAAPALPAPAAWTQYGDTDGSAVLQCWDDLGAAIRVYVDVHCAHQGPWNTLETSIKDKFNNMSRRAKEYFAIFAEAKTLLEGLIWRSLVKMLFKPVSTDGLENLEVWPGYTALLLKLDDQLASCAPHDLRTYQDPATVLAWNQTEKQPDPNQANQIHAGQAPASQLPAASQPAAPAPGWKDPAAHHLKQLYYNWRPRTAELMQLATGYKNRFHGGHVEMHVHWAIPVNLIHISPGRGARHTWMKKTIAELALRADRLMQLSSLRWEFLFADPDTPGPAPAPGARPTPTYAYDDTTGRMALHPAQAAHAQRAPGRAVDHVVRPLLRCYTLDPAAQRWDKLLHVRPMEVCVHVKGRKLPAPAPGGAGGNPGDAGNAVNTGNAGNAGN